jgi:hypothetical protein
MRRLAHPLALTAALFLVLAIGTGLMGARG